MAETVAKGEGEGEGEGQAEGDTEGEGEAEAVRTVTAFTHLLNTLSPSPSLLIQQPR